MFELRSYISNDATAINTLAVICFAQFKSKYNDWDAFAKRLEKFSELAESSEIVVAVKDSEIIGAVAYVPPHTKKAEFFPNNTPIIRMLVVSPSARGLGVGKALSEECIKKAKRDKCRAIALHTSSIMEIALPMYQRMGFNLYGPAPDIFGVKYNVYSKRIA